METGEGLPPDINLYRPLELDEVLCLRDKVIKPAVDLLWPNNSCKTAKLGDRFNVDEIIRTPAHTQMIFVEAYFSPGEDAKAHLSDDESLVIKLTVSEQKPPQEVLTPQALALLEGYYFNSLEEHLNSKEFTTWSTAVYYFDNDSEEPASLERWVEIKDRNGGYVWGCEIYKVCEELDEQTLQDYEVDHLVVYEIDPGIDEETEDCIKMIDCYKIGAALVQLGVPFKVLDQELSS